MATNKLLILLLLFFSGCQFAVRKANSYYHPNFHCESGKGRRDMNSLQFEKFMNVFWNPVKSRYDEENKIQKSAKNVIVGNSLIHLFTPDLMNREFPGKSIVNRGIGGDMTDLLAERIESNVLSLNPSTVILEIGGNDMIGGKCLGYIENNVKKIIEIIHRKNPETKIIFITVPPTRITELNEVVPVYNLFLYSLTLKKNITVLDIWTPMRETDSPTIRSEFTRFGDKIHFNEKGYKIIGDLLRPYL